MTSARKRIYIAYTGGTIGMARTERGFQPLAGFLQDKIRSLAEFSRDEMPEFELHEYQPLLDSSDMTPAQWMQIAADILTHYDRFDGFVVLHGTDTMAYTASALSFMLPDLGKPVIVTGSQIPLCEPRSDGHDNLLNALYIAAHYPRAEVGLFFHHRLLRGNRATKINSQGFDAFDSPNCDALLHAGITIESGLPELRPLHNTLPQFNALKNAAVAVVTLYPGIDFSLLQRLLEQPLDGVILQTFGSGNAPQNPALMAAFKQASERGMVLVNHSQCLSGRVDMDSYAGGHALREAGFVSAADMTLEATLTKLHVLLSAPGERSHVISEARRLMEVPLCGELSAAK